MTSMSNRENWSQNPTAGSQRADGQSSAPRVLMVLLVVLALIASILMLFLDSDLWLKIAVIAALWAAFLGIVLVSKYSSALRAEQKRVGTLERAHRAEIEREAAGYQEREAALKEDFSRQLRDQRDEHLEQLRHELISLRAQLAEMSGEELDDDQVAVQARAERIIELEQGRREQADRRYRSEGASQNAGQGSGSAQGARQGAGQGAGQGEHTNQPGASARAASSAGSPAFNRGNGHTSQPSSDNRGSAFSTGSFAAVKWTGDSTEETTQIPIIVDSSSAAGAEQAANRGSDSADEEAYRGQHERAEAEPAPRAEPAFSAYRPHHSAPEQSANQASDKQANAEQANAAQAKQADKQAEQGQAADEDQPAGSHEYRAGRRRADENSEGLTVAELMKRFEKRDN